MMEDAMAQRKRPTTQSAISLTHPNAAGIDIGSAAHFVAVPPDRDDEPVREFASFTADLHRLCDWLDACSIDTVAMESTGVYWIPLYELLESRGFTVLLVNARHVKNVSGRKSDVLDCQWLQQLMSFGLLRGAFRPAEQVCVLRSLSRQRTMLLRSQGRFVRHMQKARASADEIAKSLQGSWRAEHLFALKQALDAFDFCGTQLAECDAQVQAQLQALHVREDEPAEGKKRGRARNAPRFDLRTQLFQMCGVDLTRIDGIDVTTALVVVSEVGADMGKFPSDKHFASWLGLCPGTKITGGKVMSGKTKRCANRAAQALRLAAAALRSSQSALGAYYRRMCARMDKPKAVTAAAHKLARLIYAMLSHGQEYTDRGQDYFEERYRQRILHNLAQKAKAMGMQLVPSDNTA
jgi:transposase